MYKFNKSKLYKEQYKILWEAGFKRSAIKYYLKIKLLDICEFLDRKIW